MVIDSVLVKVYIKVQLGWNFNDSTITLVQVRRLNASKKILLNNLFQSLILKFYIGLTRFPMRNFKILNLTFLIIF